MSGSLTTILLIARTLAVPLSLASEDGGKAILCNNRELGQFGMIGNEGDGEINVRRVAGGGNLVASGHTVPEL